MITAIFRRFGLYLCVITHFKLKKRKNYTLKQQLTGLRLPHWSIGFL